MALRTKRYAVKQLPGILAVLDRKADTIHCLYHHAGKIKGLDSVLSRIPVNRHGYTWTQLDAQHLVDYLNERTSS